MIYWLKDYEVSGAKSLENVNLENIVSDNLVLAIKVLGNMLVGWSL
jgi:hypothetical protein